jgi:hypothetical protein
MTTSYQAHELALVFPPMTEPEFAAFKEDIREHGQREAITLYEGKILDGCTGIGPARSWGWSPGWCASRETRARPPSWSSAGTFTGGTSRRPSGRWSRPRCASSGPGVIRGIHPI